MRRSALDVQKLAHARQQRLLRFGDDGGGRGVLKRMVPLWLGLPEFRGLVIGFESAAVGHGGEGALYVRLRRGRGE